MSEPFLAEIRVFGFNFAPVGWAFCDGQVMPISQNTALFSLLGTNFGGNGTSTFALPNLQGSVPLQQGQGPGLTPYVLGETGGAVSVTLISSQMPSHNHLLECSTAVAGQTSPVGAIPAVPPAQRGQSFFAASPGTSPAMKAGMLTPAGGNGPHNNMPPYLTLNFCIALAGVFPSRP
jgi:microcystin-dependent protein